MSLIRWYRMNGNIIDAMGNSELVNSGTSTAVAGKIGQAMRKTSGYYLTDLTNIPDNLSISLWYKHNGATWASECIFGTRLGSNGFMLYRNASDTAGYYRAYFWYNSTSSTIVGYNQWPGISGLSPDTWYHLVMTRDSLGNFRLYKDGTLIYNGSPPSDFVSWNNNGATLAFHAQGNGSGYTAGDISFNDIRIYDHALSPKEVKELAKAKILHYKFDDMQEPTKNLVLNPEEQRSTTTYNVMQGYLSENWIEGEQYTISLKGTINSGQRFGLWRDSGSKAVTTNIPYNSEKGFYTLTFTCPPPYSPGHQLDRFSIYNYPSSGASQATIEWIQIEKKDHVTPFVNGERAGTVHDSSGYENHAELALATTPRWVPDAKIGSGAYEFDGIDDYIEVSNPLGGLFSGSFTVSMWCYFNDDSRGILFGDYARPSAINFNLEKYTNRALRFYWAGSPDIITPTNVVPLQEWCLITFVRDKESSKVVFYVNGETVYTYSGAISDKVASSLHLIGRDNRTGATAMDGRIDDLRIYATALSDEDILELYQTRGSIDSHGNLYVQDIIETGHKPLIADYTVWEDGQTGSTGLAPYFSVYSGGTSNSRILATDPWGKETVVWKSEPVTNTSTGIYIPTMPIDNTKTYRVSWWEKRVTNGDATYANYYFGLHGYGSVNGVSTLAGSISTNFYFTSGSRTSSVVTSMLGEWNLMVGVVHPHDYTGPTHPDSGRYNVNGKIGSTTNCKWLPETTTCRWRTYTIYRTGDGDSRGAVHYSAYPRVDILDGTEPSIQDLLNGFDSRYIDYVRAKGGANPITLDVGDKSSMFGTIREVGLPVRYIRDWANGSTANTSNHWVEIEAYSGGVNVALGKSATSPILTDGAVASNPYYGVSSGLRSVQVDLGEVYIVEVINVRHYYADGRTYHNTKTEVSADGVNWVTVFDSAIEGEYPETSAGNTIICRPQSFALGASGDVFINELKEV